MLDGKVKLPSTPESKIQLLRSIPFDCTVAISTFALATPALNIVTTLFVNILPELLKVKVFAPVTPNDSPP